MGIVLILIDFLKMILHGMPLKLGYCNVTSISVFLMVEAGLIDSQDFTYFRDF
jgi:hypothetical protein